MEPIKPFTQLGRNDAAIAGGKGASLGEMTQAGVPVPPGFVILADAFERFIEETKLRQKIEEVLGTVSVESMASVDTASVRIQDLILTAQIPIDIATAIEKYFKDLGAEFVAVRSSATAEDSASAAWAGQLDTFLNTTHTELLRNVQRCWASLFTPRAIFYRFEKGLHTTKISVAVVVQKMVHSSASGIAFSVHPVTEDRNQLIIEAGYGLGEAIVSGQVTPDSYVVEKSPRKIAEINVSTQTRGLYRASSGGNEWRIIQEPKASAQTLTHEQISELADLVIKIENHYGFACDIEWAFEQGKFYITQSRPITTLSAPAVISATEEKLIQTDLFKKDEWFEQGRWVQAPMVFMFFFHWHNTKILSQVAPGHTFATQFSIDDYAFEKFADAAALHAMIKQRYREGSLDELTTLLDSTGKSLTNQMQTILAEDDVSVRRQLREFFALYKEFAALWGIAVFLGDQIVHVAKEVGYVASEADMFAKVHSHLRKTWIEEEAERMRAIATQYSTSPDEVRLKKQFAQYIEDFKWIKINKWVGKPIDITFAKQRFAEEIQNYKQGNYIEPVQEEKGESDPMSRLSAAVAYWRAECGRFEMQTAMRLQPVFEKLGSEQGLTYEEVLLFTPDELLAALTGPPVQTKLIEVLKRKNGFFGAVGTSSEEIIIDSSQPLYQRLHDLYLSRASQVVEDVLHGIGASPGRIQGMARIVHSMQDADLFKDGEILVAPETTPSFVPLMRKASAILTGKGGITSHAAIVSRELKKPCVIAIKDITRILKTGDLLEVDAENGIVKILEKA